MRHAALCTLAALALAACTPKPGPVEPYAFVGTWSCETATLALTNTTFDEGKGPAPVRVVTQEGSSYTLFLADGRRMALALVTATGLTWVREGDVDQQTCRRAS
jgi:hypothetical protein